MSFSSLLATTISEAGYSSLRTFAIDAGVSREAVRAYTTGARLPSNEKLAQMGKALEILGSPTFERLGLTLAEARLGRKSAANHSYGVRATAALRTPQISNQQQAHKTNRLIEMFFEHSHRGHTPELEHFLRSRIEQILSDD